MSLMASNNAASAASSILAQSSRNSPMSETDSHSNILAEIAAIKQQIHDIKKKRDIKTPSYPVSFFLKKYGMYELQ